MHLAPGTDDDENDVFRDFDPTAFKPLRDTTPMAKLALLGPGGLNDLVRGLAGRSGNGAALGDLYSPEAPAVGDVTPAAWPVPKKLMLGWLQSPDARDPWGTPPPRGGRAYRPRTMWLVGGCVG